MIRSCQDFSRFVDLYVDGELEASQWLAAEQHIATCETCAETIAFRQAMKRSVRKRAKSETAPTNLRARIAASLEASNRDVYLQEDTIVSKPSWRHFWPWAAAAGFAIAIGGGVRVLSQNSTLYSGIASPLLSASAPNTTKFEDLIEGLAKSHARPLPPEEVDPVRMRERFSPIVGVPVRLVHLDGMQKKSSFLGARLMPIRGEPTATLSYNAGGTRVTIHIFDPHRVQFRSACCFSPKVIPSLVPKGEQQTVWVGRAKGYSLALAERDGVGYAISADSEQDVMNIAAGLQKVNYQ